MSPFEIFRRNLKPLMVLLTGLALFAFVVLPALDTYMRRGGGASATDAELASFDGKPLRRSRVEYLTRNHQSTVRFLRELAEETIRRGGAPQTPGFVYDSQNRTIQSIGIDERPSELATVRTMQFANEAKKAGFELDDTAIASWLYSFTDQGTVPEGEMFAMLMQSTQNQMGKAHLYEQLRNQLLAELYQRGNISGLAINGQIPVVTPIEQWENFLKLNREATATAYGVLVSDYLDQTNPSPTEAAINDTYEAGKNRYPNEQSADPAFARRETATFEYVVADQLAFIEREKKNFSEADLRAEYERRLAGGDFQLPQTADDILGFGDETDSSDEPEMKEDSSTESDTADKIESDENASEAKQESEPKADDSKDEPNNSDTDASDAAADAKSDDQSNNVGRSAVRLVVFQDDEKELESDVKAAEKTQEKAADEKPKKKANENTKEEKEAKPDRAKSDQPASEKSANKDESTPQEKDASAKSESNDEPAKKDEPKIESFEDVRDQIAAELAAPEARRKMQEGINDIDSQMRRYFNLNAIHDSNMKIGRESEAPVKPDLKALAEKYSMQYETIGPHDIVSLRNEPIAQSLELTNEVGRPGPPFTAMMFGVSNNQAYIPKQQLLFPLRTADMSTGKMYVSWKTEETEAYTPTLEEVREEVILAIRTEEARELARVEAVRLADEANEGKNLASLIPEDKKSNLKEALGPFSWMNSFGFGGAFLGNVPELDSVGEEFMAEVFRTKQFDYGVAANLPERVVYVVQPTGFQPSTEELRRRFKEPRERMMALLLGTEDVQSVMRGFYESVDERTGFNFAAAEEE